MSDADTPATDPSQFRLLSTVDRDSFGPTLLGEDKHQQIHAIKVLRKDFNQRPVWYRIDHPFVLEFRGLFETATCFHLVLEPACGTLSTHIEQASTKLHAAEICLGIKYLHEQGIIHRNLCLDNVMMMVDGHVKIGGFELCKQGECKSFCGTSLPAPELLLDKTYGPAVDWWALGIMIHEMTFIRTPFEGDLDDVYDGILTTDPVTIPVVQALLVKDPFQRAGLEIMSDAYFEHDWDDVLHKRIPVAFIPKEPYYDAQPYEMLAKPCDDW